MQINLGEMWMSEYDAALLVLPLAGLGATFAAGLLALGSGGPGRHYVTISHDSKGSYTVSDGTGSRTFNLTEEDMLRRMRQYQAEIWDVKFEGNVPEDTKGRVQKYYKT